MAVSDLTNTKWVIDGYGSVHYDGSMYINFTSNNTNYTKITFYTDDVSITYDTTRVCEADDMNNYTPSDWVNEAYRTIEITGGTDVTNTTLISWLQDNATQVVSTTNIILGSDTIVGVDTIKVVDANDSSAYKDFVFNNTPTTTTSIKIGDNTLNGVNTISVTGTDGTQKSFGYFTLPTFIAEDRYANIYGPYEFEQGMTFAQWVASAYNTSGWVENNMGRIVKDGFKYLRQEDFTTYVLGSDLVEAKEYDVYVDN